MLSPAPSTASLKRRSPNPEAMLGRSSLKRSASIRSVFLATHKPRSDSSIGIELLAWHQVVLQRPTTSGTRACLARCCQRSSGWRAACCCDATRFLGTHNDRGTRLQPQSVRSVQTLLQTGVHSGLSSSLCLPLRGLIEGRSRALALESILLCSVAGRRATDSLWIHPRGEASCVVPDLIAVVLCSAFIQHCRASWERSTLSALP
jgi:hypothetical protein